MSTMALPEEISEVLVKRLVHAFYARVRADGVLGPIFEARIEDRWDEHLATMVDFWSSIALMTGRYSGSPHVVHRALDLAPAHFTRWLELFDATVNDVCAGRAAAFFVDRAHRIARSLQIGIGILPMASRMRP